MSSTASQFIFCNVILIAKYETNNKNPIGLAGRWRHRVAALPGKSGKVITRYKLITVKAIITPFAPMIHLISLSHHAKQFWPLPTFQGHMHCRSWDFGLGKLKDIQWMLASTNTRRTKRSRWPFANNIPIEPWKTFPLVMSFNKCWRHIVLVGVFVFLFFCFFVFLFFLFSEFA